MSGPDRVGALTPAHLEWRIRGLEKTRDDYDKRLRAVEARLSWIMGGLALVVVEVPVVLWFFSR